MDAFIPKNITKYNSNQSVSPTGLKSFGNILKNIYNSNGTITSNRTVETGGKDLNFTESASNITVGINSELGNRAWSATHVDGDWAYAVVNKIEDAGSEQTVTMGFNTVTGVQAKTGVERIGSNIFSTMQYYDPSGPLQTYLSLFSTGLIFNVNNVSKFYIKNDGTPGFKALQVFADNAAALTGGLSVDDVYKTATGELRIVV